jgi:hypothetical protein
MLKQPGTTVYKTWSNSPPAPGIMPMMLGSYLKGSPVAELLGSLNTEEEVAHYRNHARVPWALYPQLDPSSFVFPFLSSLFSSHPWLSTAGTLAASGRLLGLPIVCAVIVAAGMNLASLRSNLRRDKNNDRKTLTLHKLFLVLWLLLKNKAIRK